MCMTNEDWRQFFTTVWKLKHLLTGWRWFQHLLGGVLQSLNDNLTPILNWKGVSALRLWRNHRSPGNITRAMNIWWLEAANTFYSQYVHWCEDGEERRRLEIHYLSNVRLWGNNSQWCSSPILAIFKTFTGTS